MYGARVRQARILRRMTGKAVLAEMGWRGARQTRLEQAEVTALDADTAARLAEVLRFPLEFFTTPPVSRVAAASLLFRAPKATSATEKEYLAQFAVAVGDFLEELNVRSQLPPVKLPALDRRTGVAAAARAARARMGMDADVPIPYLTYELERAGVAVVMRARRTKSSGELNWASDGAREKHLGYSTRVGEYGDRPLIVLRALDSWERIRWTVAHELGHLLLHADGVNSKDQEEEASRFASELLAPAAAVAEEVPKVVSLHNLVPLKLKWGISLGALLRHLSESGLIDSHRYDMLRRQLYTRINPATGHTWGRTEPGWDARVPEQPRLLAKWVERCFHATSAAMLAPRRLIWPADLLEDFLAGQRPAPSTTPSDNSSIAGTNQRRPALSAAAVPGTIALARGNVVDFDRFRNERRA
ncbi:ImmA/IrrE family metallo-endopeptidase [Pseudonocardia abyssalis]|nr:ImmA/IrrE family metallo-endopeptidase [Pseudonocardia abyssalis]